MEKFDRITIMPPVGWDVPDKIFSTDSSLKRCRGWSENGLEAFHATYPRHIKENKKIHINELELLAFVVAIKLFGDKLEDKNVLAFCDNQVSVDIVNSGAASNEFSQACLREICYLMGKRNAML